MTNCTDIQGLYFKKEMDTKGCVAQAMLMFSVAPSLLSWSLNHVVAMMA